MNATWKHRLPALLAALALNLLQPALAREQAVLYTTNNDSAVQALLAAGYRRPLCLHLPAKHLATVRRRQGLERACREAGLDPQVPHNYFPQNDPQNKPRATWRSHGNLLFINWLNYYVYQITPYDLRHMNPTLD